MRNKLKKDTKLIRIDSKLHKDLKRLAAAEEKSIKELVEYAIKEFLPDVGVD